MTEKLKYFAYISRAKIKQLHDQLSQFSVEQWSVRQGIEAQDDAEVGVDAILGLLKGGVPLSGHRTVTVGQTGKQSVVQLLIPVLEHIKQHERVLDLGSLCRRKQGVALNAFAYSYSGSFSTLAELGRSRRSGYSGGLHIPGRALEKAGNEIIISRDLLIHPAREENAFEEIGPNNGHLVSNMCIITSIIEEYTLSLACSYKYFSDMGGSWDEEEKEWSVRPHSGNHHFFEGETDAWFDTLLFITGMRGKTIMGTPLFLVSGVDPELRI
jgi:hypothetical protein